MGEQEEQDEEDEVEIAWCSCGTWHSAAVTRSGLCYTWGYGKFGQVYHRQASLENNVIDSVIQLGHGDREGSCVPRLVDGVSKHRLCKVVCGSRHTLALTGIYFSIIYSTLSPNRLDLPAASGAVFGWGFNKFGQLGEHRGEVLEDGKVSEGDVHDVLLPIRLDRAEVESENAEIQRSEGDSTELAPIRCNCADIYAGGWLSVFVLKD
jgi:hypothetical protein